jgi:hypothetical protein
MRMATPTIRMITSPVMRRFANSVMAESLSSRIVRPTTIGGCEALHNPLQNLENARDPDTAPRTLAATATANSIGCSAVLSAALGKADLSPDRQQVSFGPIPDLAAAIA